MTGWPDWPHAGCLLHQLTYVALSAALMPSPGVTDDADELLYRAEGVICFRQTKTGRVSAHTFRPLKRNSSG